MLTYPIYLLKLGDDVKVIVPEGKNDIGHSEFWEQHVSHIVAAHFHIPQAELSNLPYCQQRARICGNIIYFGGKPSKTLLSEIQRATNNDNLVFVYDNHEKRLREDVLEFRRLSGRKAWTG